MARRAIIATVTHVALFAWLAILAGQAVASVTAKGGAAVGAAPRALATARVAPMRVAIGAATTGGDVVAAVAATRVLGGRPASGAALCVLVAAQRRVRGREARGERGCGL